MKKVLIISYFFPPCNLVGAQRPYSWYKHFHKFGLYPVVITRHWNKEIATLADASLPDNAPLKIERHDWGEVHYLPYAGSLRDRFLEKRGESLSFIRRLLTVYELFAQHISFLFNPYRFFYRYVESLLADGASFCSVIISANPYPQFAIGYKLAKKYKLPWIADYRDDWTTNTRYKKIGFVNRCLAIFEKISEKNWLSNAHFFISVTDYYIQKITAFTSRTGFLVLNGFEEILPASTRTIDETIHFLYAGTVYDKQDFTLFAEGLIAFADKNPSKKIHVVFAGAAVDGICPPPVAQLLDMVVKPNVSFDVLPRQKQADFEKYRTQAHVLFTVPYGKLKGEMPAKLFHYLSWEKPILLAGSDEDVMEKTLAPYSLAYVCKSGKEVADSISNITEKYNTQGFALSENDSVYIRQFLRENQAKILADLIKKQIPTCAE